MLSASLNKTFSPSFLPFQKGTHKSLKAKKGLYWELIRKQELEEEILVHERQEAEC